MLRSCYYSINSRYWHVALTKLQLSNAVVNRGFLNIVLAPFCHAFSLLFVEWYHQAGLSRCTPGSNWFFDRVIEWFIDGFTIYWQINWFIGLLIDLFIYLFIDGLIYCIIEHSSSTRPKTFLVTDIYEFHISLQLAVTHRY